MQYFFFKFVARLIFSQSQIYPLLNILISNNRYLIWAHKYTLGTASTCRERKSHSWLIWDRSGFSIQIYFQVNPAVKSMDWKDWMKYTEWISIFIIVKLLALCKRLQHCWPKAPTNVWSCCVRTFARSLTLLRRLATVVYDPYGTTHMHTVLNGPIWLSLKVNKLVSNNFSKDRSFQRCIVLDILTNPDWVTLTKKV